jgi:predicted nucleic acid-binding protein
VTIIADASVMLAIYLEEAASPAAKAALAGQPVVAPQMILAEIANGLWRAHRTQRLGGADARRILARVPNYFDRLVPTEDLAAAALDLALRRDHPAYDCFYVALAMQEGAPLATADRRLAERFADDAAIHLLPG